MQSDNPTPLAVPLKTKIALIMFGLFLFFILLEAGLRLGGFVVLSFQEYKNQQSLRHKGTYRIMCVGESTTQGQYPPYLEGILNQHHTGIRFSVIDKGVAGTNSAIILAQLESNLDQYHPDMVVAMMGVNDQGIFYFKDIPEAETKLFRYCKTYRLIRLLWLPILAKTREEEAFKKAIALGPENDRACVELGQSYRAQGKLSQAEDAFKKAIEINPQNDDAHAELGLISLIQGNLTQAEDLHRQAIALNPKNSGAYLYLWWIHRAQGKHSQAEELLKKAIEMNPQRGRAYVELGQLYRAQGKRSQAEDLLKQAIEMNPQDDLAYGAFSVLYDEIGNPELAEAYAQKANRLRSRYYDLVTVNNYRKLKAILDKRGIRLVCVQYPMRDVEPLKKAFEDNGKGVIIVDNKNVFRDAVKKDGYTVYFVDMFGGDFGHCTAKGNRLLAENITNTILKEVFHDNL